MIFEITHSIFDTKETFTEDDPPSWLVSKECLWFWDGHVKTLAVGDSIETDFREIRRIK
jgi:hypothetical protein